MFYVCLLVLYLLYIIIIMLLKKKKKKKKIFLSISAKCRHGCREWPRWCEGVGGILRAIVTKPFSLTSCYILWNLVAR